MPRPPITTVNFLRAYYKCTPLLLATAAFLILPGQLGNTNVNNEASRVIEFYVVAEPVAASSDRRIPVTKDECIFGRDVEDRRILIDSRTGGLADVFVCIAEPSPIKPNDARKPRSHFVALANGLYTPRAFVAAEGDRIDFIAIDPVVDAPRTPFAPIAAPKSNGIETLFTLNREFDQVTKLESAIYPWMDSFVFVGANTSCGVTDRCGRCKLLVSLDADAKELEVRLYHPVLKNFSCAGNVMEGGTIRLSRRDIAQRRTPVTFSASVSAK